MLWKENRGIRFKETEEKGVFFETKENFTYIFELKRLKSKNPIYLSIRNRTNLVSLYIASAYFHLSKGSTVRGAGVKFGLAIS